MLISFQSTKALASPYDAGGGPVRSAMAALRQRFTLRQTQRTSPAFFSFRWCRRANGAARGFGRLTVNISSSRSRMRAPNARCLLIEPAAEITKQPQGLVCIVEFPGLAPRLAYRPMKRFWQTFDHVAGLLDLAPLTGSDQASLRSTALRRIFARSSWRSAAPSGAKRRNREDVQSSEAQVG